MRSKISERKFHFLPLLGAGEISDTVKRWTHSQEMPLPIDFKEVEKKEERLFFFNLDGKLSGDGRQMTIWKGIFSELTL